MRKLLLLFFLLSSLVQIRAQSGGFDLSFGYKGKIFPQFIPWRISSGTAQRILIRKDGKIILVLLNSPQPLLQLTMDGTVDSSFGINGRSEYLNSASFVSAVLQPDGQIVLLGAISSSSTSTDFVLYRFRQDGFLDKRFGTNGHQVTDLGFGSADVPTGIALQNDGKMVVVGNTSQNGGSEWDVALVRYNNDGTLDNTLGGDGIQIVDFGSDDFANAIAIENDGKIITAGYTGSISTSNTSDFSVMRYNTNGIPDNSFGNNGVQYTDFGYNETASAVAIQSNGKIVVTGYSNDGHQLDFATARYNLNGSLDDSFSEDGKRTENFGPRDFARAVTVQPDGKIIIVGSNDIDGRSDFTLVRYDSDGTLDKTFAGDGKVATDFSTLDDEANAVMVLANEKILVAGKAASENTDVGGGATFSDYAICRYLANGTLDTTFDLDGKIIGRSDYETSLLSRILVQPNGEVLAAGIVRNTGGGRGIALARFYPNGVFDTTFSKDGKLTFFAPFKDADAFFSVNSLRLQSDGKILVAGSAVKYSTFKTILVRYNPDGTLDHTLHGDGMLIGTGDPILDADILAVQKDGKILIGTAGDSGDFSITRLLPDGTFDNAFGVNGKTSVNFGSREVMTALTLQGDGKILIAGYTERDSFKDLAVARLNYDGTLDKNFDTDGKLVATFSDFEFHTRAMEVLRDGKIVLAGEASTAGNMNFGLVQLNADGTIDQSFGDMGIAVTDFGTNEQAISIALQDDGKIIAGGRKSEANASVMFDFALARYNSNGFLDSSFNGDGKLVTDLANDRLNDIAIYKDKLYVAGTLMNALPDPLVHEGTGLITAYQLEMAAPMLAINDVTVKEGQENAILTVNLSRASTQTVILSYETLDGTAKQGQDYRKQKGSVLIPAGQLSQTITIWIKAGKSKEATEYFEVELYPVSVADDVILKDLTGKVTIENNRKNIASKLNIAPQEQVSRTLQLVVAPNPTSTYFTLRLTGGSNQMVNIRVRDAAGRLIQTLNSSTEHYLQLGANYCAGLYYVEALQGNVRQIATLLKLAP